MNGDFSLDHAVIAVHDLAQATADYELLLGRRPSWRGEHPAYGTANTLFRIDNTYIELLALDARARPKERRWASGLQEFLETRGEGLYALALGTDDIARAVADARDAGLDVADARDGQGVDLASGARRAWRNALVDAKSTNGTRLFLIQHHSPPDALPRAELAAPHGSFATRLDHVVVLSADMEAARRVWGHGLGARLALDRSFPDRNTRILFFRLRDITVEISGGATQSREGLGKPDRLWGLAWGVGSVQAAATRLRDAGVDASQARDGIKPGTRVSTVKGAQTHGVATLLIEHTPESFRSESRAPQGTARDNASQRRAFTALALGRIDVLADDVATTAGKWQRLLDMPPAGKGLLDARNTRIRLRPRAGDDEATPPGMASISIVVDDLWSAVADLRAKGVLVADDGDRAWVDRASTNGVTIELVERRGEA